MADSSSFPSTLDSSVAALKQSILNNLTFRLARFPERATKRDWMLAVSYAAKDRILERLQATQAKHQKTKAIICRLSF
jgi:glycogen phosphorylase